MKTTEQLAATVRSIRSAARLAVLQYDRHAAQHMVDSAEAFERVAIAEIERRDAVMQQMAEALGAVWSCDGSECNCGLSEQEMEGWGKVAVAMKAYLELCNGN
jgi:hypothetical protein